MTPRPVRGGIRGPRRSSLRRVVAALSALTVLVVPAAVAAWLITSLPGAAAARATSLSAVTGVVAAASGQHSVSVSWQEATLPEDAGAATYTVLAYPAAGGAARTPGGTCAGTISATTCEDSSVPDGTWLYRVSVRLGSWTGPASDVSAPVELPAATNPVAAENQQPGSPASEWDVEGAGDSTIQGFATDMSTNRGGTVRFKVDTTATTFHVDIYRLGWYGGDGARKVDDHSRLRHRRHPAAGVPARRHRDHRLRELDRLGHVAGAQRRCVGCLPRPARPPGQRRCQPRALRGSR